MDIRERKLIPEGVARRLLNVSGAQWKTLVAERVVHVEVARDGRGGQLMTDIASLVRAGVRTAQRR